MAARIRLVERTPVHRLYKSVGWIISQEPDVVLIDELDDAKSAGDLARYASENRRVYIGMRAPSTKSPMAVEVATNDSLGTSKPKRAAVRIPP